MCVLLCMLGSVCVYLCVCVIVYFGSVCVYLCVCVIVYFGSVCVYLCVCVCVVGKRESPKSLTICTCLLLLYTCTSYYYTESMA